jgi:hypothetical protein
MHFASKPRIPSITANQSNSTIPASVPPSTAKNAANGIHRAHSMSSQLFPQGLWEHAHILWARVNRDYRTPDTRGLAEIYLTDPPRSRNSRDPNLGGKYRGAPIPLQDFFWAPKKKNATQPKTSFPFTSRYRKLAFKKTSLPP